ncbi:signal sequence binding protein [Sanghuangporus baumii]|uniref:Signal sequence binding protein n=1 Tax=Sanghuangporus baumii TaxID=108892 RepID=A0A9Q5N183_SANBA|nr:signal sequence binding protein [Sanghuangporus baumii]
MIPFLLLRWVLLCWSWTLPNEVSAQQPQVTFTKFAPFRSSLHFFANSTSALYVDSWTNGSIFITNDEAKTWREVDLPRNIRKEVIMHPCNNQYAFVEMDEGPFYVTSDQGVSWTSFELPGSKSYSDKPFAFHPDLPEHALIVRQRCVPSERLGQICNSDYYVTRDGFTSEPSLLLRNARSCLFARSLESTSSEVHQDLILCLVGEWSGDLPFSPRLLASSDFFQAEKRVIDFGLRRNSYHVSDLSFIGKFAIADLYSASQEDSSRLKLISTDLIHWERIGFSNLRGPYSFLSILPFTDSKLGAFDSNMGHIGTLYASNSNGSSFVEVLKNVHSSRGFFSFEKVAGAGHAIFAKVVANFSEAWDPPNDEHRSRISFDDGSTWKHLTPSSEDASSSVIPCDPRDEELCSLHFHQPTLTKDAPWIEKDASTGSPAPGIVIRIGSIGPYLAPYEDCDTFISTDGGLNWRLLMSGPHIFEFSNHGNTIVLVKDTDDTDEVLYSIDSGQSWKSLRLEHRVYPVQLSASPAEASDTFLLIGRIAHEDRFLTARELLIFSLDFSVLSRQACDDDDLERWYAEDGESSGCILGHREWYLRRKIGANCSIQHNFQEYEIKGIEDDCPCTQSDYECDFNYVRHGKTCIPVIPESIPEGSCHSSQGTYWGPSGYRLKAGNSCDKLRGVVMEQPVQKDCSMPQLPEGEIGIMTFQFPNEVVQLEYLMESETILIRLRDGSVWQSRNEGYTWVQLFSDERFLTLVTHKYSPHRAYLLTHANKYFYTTDAGRSWNQLAAPVPSNTFGAPILSFNPSVEYLIWVGDAGCDETQTQSKANCHTEAYYSVNHGRSWEFVESYIRHCEWAREAETIRDSSQITCEAYGGKAGNQRHFTAISNSLQLVTGRNFYKEKRVLLQNVVGFLRSPDYDLVAKYQEDTRSLTTLASKDGTTFSEAIFPAGFHPDNRYLQILDTTPQSIFIFLTTSENPNPSWGVVLKSDAAGSAYVVSRDYVNESGRGNIDFTRLPLLQGIILMNVVADPDDSTITGRKELMTLISRNDGGSWKSLSPPKKDSADREYVCASSVASACALHLHAFSERSNSRSSITVASRPDLLISVGNVGEVLAPYRQSDTFLSRDAGLTWSEIRKGTHVWAFGDGGSLLVMAPDAATTDRVVYSTDEGLTWHEFKFKGMDRIRVRSIITTPNESSRRFVLFGYNPHSMDVSVAVQLDFSFLTKKRCTLNEEKPDESDFELWSPVGQDGSCLFGQRATYQRSIRGRNCYIGDVTMLNRGTYENCPCTEADFECEFNHARDSTGACVLEPGASPLPNNTFCSPEEDRWYERTGYRKIGYSDCKGGLMLDRGTEHECTPKSSWSLRNHGWLFWTTVTYFSIALGALAAYTVFRCCGFSRGKIRLADEDEAETNSRSRVVRAFVTPPLSVGGFIAHTFKRVVQKLPNGPWKKTSSGRSGEDEHLLSLEDE